jgi:hypothetical protein
MPDQENGEKAKVQDTGVTNGEGGGCVRYASLATNEIHPMDAGLSKLVAKSWLPAGPC